MLKRFAAFGLVAALAVAPVVLTAQSTGAAAQGMSGAAVDAQAKPARIKHKRVRRAH